MTLIDESRLLVRALGALRLRNLLAGLGIGLIPFCIYYALLGVWLASAGGGIVSVSLLALALAVMWARQLPSRKTLNATLALVNTGAVVGISGLGTAGVAWIGPVVFINLLLGGAVLGATFTLATVLLITALAGTYRDPDLIASVLGALFLSGMMAFAITVSLRDHLGRLQLEANQDPLTGAVNRRGLSRMLNSRLAQLDRQQPLSLILFDLDHFKELNDQLGHTMGDTALVGFVRLLLAHLRSTDDVYRYGGEEFVVLVDVDQHKALQIAETLRAAVAEHELAPGADVTVSAGVAQAVPMDTEESLIKRADRALYRAKAAGRNCCALADEPG